jgi:hypothetical protein
MCVELFQARGVRPHVVHVKNAFVPVQGIQLLSGPASLRVSEVQHTGCVNNNIKIIKINKTYNKYKKKFKTKTYNKLKNLTRYIIS